MSGLSGKGQISLNDYELLISYNHSTFTLESVNAIISRNPHLTSLAIELINNRFDELLSTCKPKEIIRLSQDILSNSEGYKLKSYLKLMINLAKLDFKFFNQIPINKFFRISNMTNDLVDLLIEKEQYEILYKSIEAFPDQYSPNNQFRILEVLVDKFPISHRLVKFASDNRKKISLDNFYKLTLLLFEYMPERQEDISLKVLDELYERSRSGRSLTPDKRVKLFELIIGHLGINQQRLRELKSLYSKHFKQLSLCNQLSLLELLATYDEDREFVQKVITECYHYLWKKNIFTSELKINFLAILLRFSPDSSLIQKITDEFIGDTYLFRRLGIKEKNRLLEVILAYSPNTQLSSHILTVFRISEQYKWAL